MPSPADEPTAAPPVRLLLMRHAKAAWPQGVLDHDRPLAGRGRTDAPGVGRWLASTGWVPELLVCSDAARTRETAELVVQGLGASPALRLEHGLYESGVEQLLEVVARTQPDVRTLLLIGHEPTMSASTGVLTERYVRFPTAAVAQIELDGTWADITAGAGRLVRLRTPKD